MAIDDPLIEKDQLLVGGKGLVPQIFAAFLAGVMVLANSIAYCGIVASCGFLTDAFGALVQQAICVFRANKETRAETVPAGRSGEEVASRDGCSRWPVKSTRACRAAHPR